MIKGALQWIAGIHARAFGQRQRFRRRRVLPRRCLQGDHLLTLYEAEDQYYGRLLGVAYAEVFRSAAPLLVEDPTAFLPVPQG